MYDNFSLVGYVGLTKVYLLFIKSLVFWIRFMLFNSVLGTAVCMIRVDLFLSVSVFINIEKLVGSF